MNWETILEQLDESTREAARTLINETEAKLKQAREESIERRNKLKSLKEQMARYERALAALGHDPEEVDPETLETEGEQQTKADAKQQWEMKQLRKQLETLQQERDTLLNEKRRLSLQQQLSRALSGTELIDRELVEQVLLSSTKWVDDTPVLKLGEDELPLEEGVKTFLASKPHLLKSKGGAGSGQRAGEGGGVRNPFLKSSWNLTEQMRLMKENPTLAQQLKQQAQQED